jgi:hypothetical protein
MLRKVMRRRGTQMTMVGQEDDPVGQEYWEENARVGESERLSAARCVIDLQIIERNKLSAVQKINVLFRPEPAGLVWILCQLSGEIDRVIEGPQEFPTDPGDALFIDWEMECATKKNQKESIKSRQTSGSYE